ncbi:MAG: hypothetical protein ACRDPA_05540 [Solirubrobacteraceae bacterium]
MPSIRAVGRPLGWLLVAGALIAGGSLIPLGLASAAPQQRHHDSHGGNPGFHGGQSNPWVTSWAASPQVAVPGSLSDTGFDNQTVRNIVFTSVGGNVVRVRFTNTFGTSPLDIGDASIALAGSGTTAATGRDVPLLFSGQSSVEIPPGAEALSDPVRLDVPALQDIAVSVYLPDATRPATQHSDGQQINYVASGDHALDRSATAYTTQTQ